MSKISLQPNASGTGTFTLAAPDSNTNRTLTLPDEAGKILTDVGVPTSAMPAGSVIQVVQSTHSTFINSTSETFFDSGLSASITPSSTSSKILVLMSVPMAALRQLPPASAAVQILRGATAIYTGRRTPFLNAAGGLSDFVHIQTNMFLSVLDSPSTSSSVSYKLQVRTEDNSSSGSVRVNDTSTASYITLMEIAG